MLDKILKVFDPLVSQSVKNYDNNYLFYGLFGAFILLMLLIGYIIFKAIT